MHLKLAVSIASLVFLNSCTLFGWSPDSYPLLEGNGESGTQTIATTATRRLAYINKKSGQLVAEPPPDVAQAISQSVTAALSASYKDKAKVDLQGVAEITRNLTRLGGRGQGVHFFRDAAFNLQLMQMNADNTPLPTEHSAARALLDKMQEEESRSGDSLVKGSDGLAAIYSSLNGLRKDAEDQLQLTGHIDPVTLEQIRILAERGIIQTATAKTDKKEAAALERNVSDGFLNIVALASMLQNTDKSLLRELHHAMNIAERLIAAEIAANPMISTPADSVDSTMTNRFSSTASTVQRGSKLRIVYYDPNRHDKSTITAHYQEGASQPKAVPLTFDDAGIGTGETAEVGKNGERVLIIRYRTSLPHPVMIIDPPKTSGGDNGSGKDGDTKSAKDNDENKRTEDARVIGLVRRKT